MNSETDSEIRVLEVVRDVCEVLGITKYIPEKVVFWAGSSIREKIRFVPSDVVFFPGNKILLSEKVKNVLSPEELRPLIASSIIYAFYSRKMRIGLLLRALAGYGLIGLFAISLIFALTPVVPLWENILGWILAFFFGASGILYGWLAGPRYSRKLRLRADLFAAKYVGTETLQSTLDKLQAAHLADLTRLETKRRARLLSTTPSISARLENLARLPPSTISTNQK